ncbi:MAG TPA: TonB-dependent siderophore receptor [Candidatus Binatia bacterium]|nr:TonB-dependent siderophore receptor [Candidatus Binatia bacterium]
MPASSARRAVRDILFSASIGALTVVAFVTLLAGRSVAAAAPATSVLVRVAQTANGAVLTDSDGFTLYIYDADSANRSTCVAACSLTWPPLVVASGATPTEPYSIVVRSDGTRQWAYRGRPLYRYRGDARPGETLGSAGGWHVARPTAADAARAQPLTIGTTTARSQATSYRALDASTATKTDTPILQTPVSVVVVTQQVLQDQQDVNIAQAIANVSGVSVGGGGAADNGQPFSSIFLRGFLTDSHFRDGVRLDSFGGDSDTYGLQLANVDSVEVLKGPAAILYGAVEPGGIVNVVTKQPLATPYYSILQQLGSYDFSRLAIDTSGPLSSDGKLLYRVNASFENQGSWVDYVYDNNSFFAPVMRYKFDPATQLTLQYEYHHLDLGQNYGFVPLLNGAPVNPSINANYGNVSPDVETTNFWDLSFSHHFASGWEIKQTFVLNDTDVDSAGLYPSTIKNHADTSSGWGVGRAINNVVNENQNWSAITDLTQHATTGDVKHTLLFGGDFYHFGTDGQINQAGETNKNLSYVDLFDPVNPGTPFKRPTTPLLFDTNANGSLGLYAQDQVEFPGNIFALAGLRYQELHQTSSVTFYPYPAAASPILNATAITPRLGLLWQPQKYLSLYADYSGNFGPNAPGDILPSGANVPPTSATQWEFGVKSALLGSQLTVSAAYFDLTKTNIPTPDPSNPNFVLITGAARSTGVEFDLQGQFAPQWQAVANYAVTNAVVTSSNDPINPVGSPLGEVPHYLARLWVTHDFRKSPNGPKIGGGIGFNGPEPYLYAGGSGLVIPPYCTVDLMASDGFRIGQSSVRAQINATNVFNRRYYADAQNSSSFFVTKAPYTAFTALYGPPQQVTGEIVFGL